MHSATLSLTLSLKTLPWKPLMSSGLLSISSSYSLFGLAINIVSFTTTWYQSILAILWTSARTLFGSVIIWSWFFFAAVHLPVKFFSYTLGAMVQDSFSNFMELSLLLLLKSGCSLSDISWSIAVFFRAQSLLDWAKSLLISSAVLKLACWIFQ